MQYNNYITEKDQLRTLPGYSIYGDTYQLPESREAYRYERNSYSIKAEEPYNSTWLYNGYRRKSYDSDDYYYYDKVYTRVRGIRKAFAQYATSLKSVMPLYNFFCYPEVTLHYIWDCT